MSAVGLGSVERRNWLPRGLNICRIAGPAGPTSPDVQPDALVLATIATVAFGFQTAGFRQQRRKGLSVMASSPAELLRFLEQNEADLFGEPFTERPFAADEYARRQQVFRAAMTGAGVDVTVLTAPDTIAWLHGYRSRWYRQHTSTSLPPTQCSVVDSHTDTLFMIEAGYHEELVRATSSVIDIRCLPSDLTHETGLAEYIGFLLGQLATIGKGPLVVGLELWSCIPSPAVSKQVEAAIVEAGHTIVDVTLPVRSARRRKSVAEIDAMEKAQAACDAGLLALRDNVRPGMTELEAWAEYLSAVVAADGEPAALHETVAAGPLMPSLHRLSSRSPLRPGRIFHADAASSYYGYHARATRPYYIGSPPPELHELTAVAAGAYEVLSNVGRVGTPWQELLAALREYYASTGIEGAAAGYEMGITVPPADWVNEFTYSSADETMTGVIEENLVTNFETWNALALVDLVVFEKSGPRVLSKVPRELLVIGA
jgi:Xaa-Pro aminopeptidase